MFSSHDDDFSSRMLEKLLSVSFASVLQNTFLKILLRLISAEGDFRSLLIRLSIAIYGIAPSVMLIDVWDVDHGYWITCMSFTT